MIVRDLLFDDKFIVVDLIDIGIFVTSNLKVFDVFIVLMCADYGVLIMNFVVGFFLYVFIEKRCRSPPFYQFKKTN